MRADNTVPSGLIGVGAEQLEMLHQYGGRCINK